VYLRERLCDSFLNPGLGRKVLISRDFHYMGRSYGFGERLNSEVEIVGVVTDAP
jgi:hypothetical protein